MLFFVVDSRVCVCVCVWVGGGGGVNDGLGTCSVASNLLENV